jgi:hypothetical protein
MSRLTRRIIDICGSCDQQEYCRYTPNAGNCYLRQLHEKLKHYEDLEEQLMKSAEIDIDSMIGEFMHYYKLKKENRLKELPCAVGDTVYMIQRRYTKCSKHREYRDEYNCQGCEELVCDSHIEHYIQPLNSAPIDWIVKMDNQFGKTAFLTKEEAEAKLKGLKGE